MIVYRRSSLVGMQRTGNAREPKSSSDNDYKATAQNRYLAGSKVDTRQGPITPVNVWKKVPVQ
jgi:hypothetical protein